ncbi:MAG TPA: DUF3631 domain-containing protein [Candidatus Binatia bacterium]|jgi:putative DNA primase/helicase|nr:DUF3631 domain-containing protein [Candidatus Binatia bacterium]
MNTKHDNNQQIPSNQSSTNQPAIPPDIQSAGPVNGVHIEPPKPLANPSVHFPEIEPWPEPVDGKALLDDILAELRRFIVFPKWTAETIALWVLHTYACYLRDVATYLAIESPERECGKSTLLTVLLGLVYRPLPSANISSSAFFRGIAEFGPTLLIDEADTMLRGREELRGILNAGYTRATAFVWRISYDLPAADPSSTNPSIQQSTSPPLPSINPSIQPSLPPPINPLIQKSINPVSSGRLVRFSCFGPKAIASIGRVNETLASRCIVISMQRKADGEQCERLKHLNTLDLRRKCLRFVQDNAAAIAAAEPKIPAGLTNRAADIWEPLLALADLAGGQWPELARQAAVNLTARAHEQSPVAALLLDIFMVFMSNKADRLASRELVAGLNACSDRPWAALNRGKPITPLWLGHQLQRYGVRPRSIRFGDSTAKGYVLEEFSETFKRYIPRSDAEAFKAEILQSIQPEPPEPNGPPQPPPTGPAPSDQLPPPAA